MKTGAGLFSAVFVILLLIVPISAVHEISPPRMRLSDISTHPFVIGSYLQYEAAIDVLRIWNYSIDAHTIISTNGSILYEPNVRSNLSIRIDFTEQVNSNEMKIAIKYSAATSIGFSIDTAFSLNLNPITGACTVQNGSFVGLSGKLVLLYDSLSPAPNESISSLENHNVTVRRYLQTVGIEIMGGYQSSRVYNCSFYDHVDGARIYRRYYDEDSYLLTSCLGDIGDSILLGLANISYIIGSLDLVATNIDIGSPVVFPVDSGALSAMILGGAGIVIFVGFYVLIYRAQRKPSEKAQLKRERRKKKMHNYLDS